MKLKKVTIKESDKLTPLAIKNISSSGYIFESCGYTKYVGGRYRCVNPYDQHACVYDSYVDEKGYTHIAIGHCATAEDKGKFICKCVK
jgi:hypothetical protein